jgi:hypothetical protein
MHFSKPFPQDYRRPDHAEALLIQDLRKAFEALAAQGCLKDDIAMGLVDESSPQNRANTACYSQPRKSL